MIWENEVKLIIKRDTEINQPKDLPFLFDGILINLWTHPVSKYKIIRYALRMQLIKIK